jgi:3-oxoacyl-[acyl-carrier protein] reductase
MTGETRCGGWEWLRGRTALVTGASSGIGYATAVALGSAGAIVGVHYNRNRGGAEAALADIQAAGGRAFAIQADVSRSDQVERMFTEMDRLAGAHLDLLVNNAGEWMDRMLVRDCPEDQWDRMMAVNAKSVFLCCRQAARRMIDAGGGAIVNLGSIVGHTGGSGGTLPYAAAKAAVHTFTRGLAKELAPHGIRVNAVAPGFADTPMLVGRVTHERAQQSTPLGRMAEPGEIASMILTLLSPVSSFVTGQIIDVNGGMLVR